jgi:hypothetical protein
MQISLQVDKNNLHHAYLLEGDKNEIIPQVFALFLVPISNFQIFEPQYTKLKQLGQVSDFE